MDGGGFVSQLPKIQHAWDKQTEHIAQFLTEKNHKVWMEKCNQMAWLGHYIKFP